MELNLQTQASLFEARQNDIRFMAQTRGGFPQFVPEFIQRIAAQVFHFNILQVVPDAFVRVEVRGITGQLFQVNATGRTLSEKGFDLVTAMSRQTVPDKQEFARNVTQHMPQKLHNGRPPEGP
jgi:hypothetical protein